jgi:hypothetical protein
MKKLSPVARGSVVVRCLLDDKHVFLATNSSTWVTIIDGVRYRFYGALMLGTQIMIHSMYLWCVKLQHSLLPVVGVEPVTSTVASPESCCPQCEIVLPDPSLELPGGAWQLILLVMLFSSLPQAVSSQEWLFVTSFGLKAQPRLEHKARAKSAPSRSQLWVRFWFPDLVPRRCLHTVGKHILGPVFEYAFGS